MISVFDELRQIYSVVCRTFMRNHCLFSFIYGVLNLRHDNFDYVKYNYKT